MYEKRLVLNFNGKNMISVGFGQGKDFEVIFSIDGIDKGLIISREIYSRDLDESTLLPLTNTKKGIEPYVGGFDGYLESYSDKSIIFQSGLEVDYKLTPETYIDLNYWSPGHIVIDKKNKEINISILSIEVNTESESEYFLEKFIIKGVKGDVWEDIDINGACENIGNHITVKPNMLLEVLVHNRQNVCLF